MLFNIILTIFWNVREISNKKLQIIFKKITKIKKVTVLVTTSWQQFGTVMEESVSVGAKGSDAGPHLKAPYKEDSPPHTGSKLNMSLYAYVAHISQSNNS